ncbi:hypothetical protein JX265_012671 [Neoarthrinium moseri]|uniref:Uncharacterized protein n=1 Tax=Neoarthrinium moseri TaxID=1658444 RepID=A0A9P9WAF0_9PEZI|nr:hypothetical protein JX266_011271 [Neoarthrinium moseri]KAI1853840.1 hypothetical protein JX265_012671 [Neoarthrinium moseri]
MPLVAGHWRMQFDTSLHCIAARVPRVSWLAAVMSDSRETQLPPPAQNTAGFALARRIKGAAGESRVKNAEEAKEKKKPDGTLANTAGGEG